MAGFEFVPKKEKMSQLLPRVVLEFPDYILLIHEPLAFNMRLKNYSTKESSSIEIDFGEYVYVPREELEGMDDDETESNEIDYEFLV